MAIITPGRMINTIVRKDVVNGGLNKADVTVNQNGSPASKKVVLFQYPTMILVRAGISDAATGLISFDNIKADDYVAIAIDRSGNLDAESAGPFTSVPMS